LIPPWALKIQIDPTVWMRRPQLVKFIGKQLLQAGIRRRESDPQTQSGSIEIKQPAILAAIASRTIRLRQARLVGDRRR
jgi:hypothetical protein